MNLLFFLTPKNDVAFLYQDSTLRQALEKMEYHRYSVIPVLKRNGEYFSTLSEGDLLWYIKNQHNLDILKAEDVYIYDVPRIKNYKSVPVTATIDSLIELAQVQNFIPVVDDRNSFIGIIKRKDIIEYCYDNYKKFYLEVKAEVEHAENFITK